MKRLALKAKALIFDMDGVITNTMPDHYRAWRTVLAQEGIYPSRFDIYGREGQPGIISVKELLAKYQIRFNRKKAQEILEKKEELFKKNVRQRFIPGARLFIRRVHQRRFRLALVTGTSKHELHRILPDKIYKLFDVVVTGNDVRRGKPHPEPFAKVLKMLKIKNSQGVVFENAPFGIRSAKGAGLKCIALETSLSREHLKKADLIFPSFKVMEKKIHFDLWR